ncbi:hypothetical protein K450DRAFT_242035 [Umbelopsis ramanniana AG]|uniref:PRA1 family protein n=1 Tax=Umbelopsis ramanniana AG TaxID=1314678 RepID=A0AAD5E948_UMBRA|nr:uncharacterized protein K450DRAFT_242035 [Umbelopsis ramanniana AG]KAI8579413.1 hypothetical protein K450DRAFT_242035 [Umbelopsis ramanniana AG]
MSAKTAPSFNPEQIASAASTAASAVASDPRFGFLHRLRNERFGQLRPLSEFFDRHRFSLTTSFQTISQRWSYNLQYFQSNYAIIVLALSIYAVITSPLLLFTIAFIFGGFYLISRQGGQPLTIGGSVISPSTMYAFYGGASLILLLFSGATGAIFWIIGAAAVIVLGHAAMLEPGLEGDFASGPVQV